MIHLSEDVVACLNTFVMDNMCITEAGGNYYIKTFDCREMHSNIPGWVVNDEFHPARVMRWWTSRPDLNGITENLLDAMAMLAAVGRFKYDHIGSLARLSDTLLLAQIKPLCNIYCEDQSRLSASLTMLLET